VSATTRVSFGVYNNQQDINQLVDAIQFAREKLRIA
jgi:selenocysteine lyase/cysteine desulfurase